VKEFRPLEKFDEARCYDLAGNYVGYGVLMDVAKGTFHLVGDGTMEYLGGYLLSISGDTYVVNPREQKELL